LSSRRSPAYSATSIYSIQPATSQSHLRCGRVRARPDASDRREAVLANLDIFLGHQMAPPRAWESPPQTGPIHQACSCAATRRRAESPAIRRPPADSPPPRRGTGQLGSLVLSGRRAAIVHRHQFALSGLSAVQPASRGRRTAMEGAGQRPGLPPLFPQASYAPLFRRFGVSRGHLAVFSRV
jgi:hypothetical protein